MSLRWGISIAAITTIWGCFPGSGIAVDHLECVDGVCACLAGYGNCDDNASNGCETNVARNAGHCGACGNDCRNGNCIAGECQNANVDYADCNDSPVDGFESHMPTDADHCGACGHDCLGGACIDGSCQPFEAVGAGFWFGTLAHDDDYFYFCEAYVGALMRVPVAGGPADTLVLDQLCYWDSFDLTSPSSWFDLVAGGGRVFWVTSIGFWGEGLFSFDVSTGEIELIDRSDVFTGLAIDDGQLAYTKVVCDEENSIEYCQRRDEYPYVLMTMNVAPGSKPKQLAHSPIWIGLPTIRDGVVYYVDEVSFVHETHDGPQEGTVNRVNHVPVDGSGDWDRFLSGEKQIWKLDAADGHLSWMERDTELDEFGSSQFVGPSRVYVHDFAGDAENRLLVRETPTNVEHVFIDEGLAYWTEQDATLANRLLRASVSGGASQTIVEQQHVRAPLPLDDAIYWIDYPARLFGLVKD